MSMRRSTIEFCAVIFVLCGIGVGQFIVHALSSLRISFADEQTEIFDEMVAKAIESLRRSPPDTQAAVNYLQYAHNYYPSGTKQSQDSRLDRIVERCRRLAELRIIAELRETTGKDLGTDADAWIREFGSDPSSPL